MAGIYIHIPFCRQKCYYCDFYKTVNTSLTLSFIQSLQQEIQLQKNYLKDEAVETIYFGGGTPSVLKVNELQEILTSVQSNFKVDKKAEITFEANADDLSPEYLQGIKNSGINRLSIGIQSFQSKHLEKMNRRHNSEQAIQAVQNARKTGFKNITVDLIYGLPELTLDEWISDLKKVFQLPVHHISAYHLTYHEGTPFYTWLKKGTLKEISEPESIQQFEALIDLAEKNGFEQYEISNFAKDKMYSKHNSSYWLGKNYLGLGPSAHSFNGFSRSWNMAHLEAYIKAISEKQNWFETETLSKTDKYNEYIITRIRTIWGVSSNHIKKIFGVEKEKHFLESISKYKKLNLVIQQEDVFTLSKKGLFVSDDIMENLMII